MRITADMAPLRVELPTDGKLVAPPGLPPVIFYRYADSEEGALDVMTKTATYTISFENGHWRARTPGAIGAAGSSCRE